jgi:hypothetical protein
MNYFTHVCIKITEDAFIFKQVFQYYEDLLVARDIARPHACLSTEAFRKIKEVEEGGVGAEFFATSDMHFIIEGDEANVPVISSLLQIALRQTQIEKIVFQYAQTTNKPTIDGYGGGAVCITRRSIREVNTSEVVAKFMRTK